MFVSCMPSRNTDEDDECIANLGEPVFVNVYHLVSFSAFHSFTAALAKWHESWRISYWNCSL